MFGYLHSIRHLLLSTLLCGVLFISPMTPAQLTETKRSLEQQRALTRELDQLNSDIAKNGNNLEARVRLAQLLCESANDHTAALEQINTVLTRNPRHLLANQLKARITKIQGQEQAHLQALLQLAVIADPAWPLWVDELNQYRSTSFQAEERILEQLRMMSRDPAHGAKASQIAADALQGQGEFEQARAFRNRLGFIRDWSIIGPFKNERNAGFNQAKGPEKEINFEAIYPGRLNPVFWRTLPKSMIRPDGIVQLSPLMYPNDQAMAYAITFVYSPSETPAVIRMGAEASVKVWFNQREVLRDDRPHRYVMDQYAIPVIMRAGWNMVLLKLTRTHAAWQYSLRITRPDGQVARQLRYSNQFQHSPDESKLKAPEFDYETSVIDQLSTLAKEKNNAHYYGLLARAYLRESRIEEAIQSAEQALKFNPFSAESHFRLAYLYQRQRQLEKSMDHLTRAISLDPDHLHAQRYLVQVYLSSGLHDRAMDLIQQLVKAHPNHLPLLRQYVRVLSTKGFHELAYRQLGQLNNLYPDHLGVKVDFYLAKRQRGDEASWRFFVRELGDQWPEHTLVEELEWQRLKESHDENAKLIYLERLIKKYPSRMKVKYQHIHQLINMKRYQQAITAIQQLQKFIPQSPLPDEILAHVYLKLGEDEKAVIAWKQSLKKNPQNQRIREYLDFVDPQKNAVFAHYEVKAERLQRIMAEKVNPQKYPKASSALLLDFMITQLHQDGSTDNQLHQLIQIFNEDGRDEFKTYPLPSHQSKVKVARVIKPDGRIVDATEIRDAVIHFARLQPGDLIEVKLEYHLSDRGWLSRHWNMEWYFQGNQPFLNSQFILLHPENKKIISQMQDAPGVNVNYTEEAFQKLSVKSWAAQNTSVPELEPHRPPFDDVASKLMLTTINSWDELARWQWSLTKDRFVTDSALKKKVAELTEGKNSREEKIRAIAHFVMREIQYKQDYTRPILGVQPHTAAQCFSRQRGDCKDKTTLLIAMLREVGIEAEFVMLRTRDEGKFYRDLPSNQWNHAIAYVKPEQPGDQGMYIDGTALWQPYDLQPLANQGTIATHLNDGKFTFKTIPVTQPQRNQSQRQLNLYLKADGSATGDFTYLLTGNLAPNFRYNLQKPQQFMTSMERFLGGIYPGSKITGFKHSPMHDKEKPAWVRLDADFKNLLIPQGNQFRLYEPSAYRFDLTRRYAAQQTRQFDLDLGLTQTRSIERSYHLPEHMKVSELPESSEVKSKHMNWAREVTLKDHILRIKTTLTINSLVIPQADYEELRSFALEVDQMEQSPVLLKKDAGE